MEVSQFLPDGASGCGRRLAFVLLDSVITTKLLISNVMMLRNIQIFFFL